MDISIKYPDLPEFIKIKKEDLYITRETEFKEKIILKK